MIETQTSMPLLSNFDAHFALVWSKPEALNLLEELVVEGKQLSAICLTEIQKSHLKCTNDQPLSDDLYLDYQLIFEWMEEVKDFFIAWRDVTFEQFKGNILLNDEKITNHQLVNLNVASSLAIEKVKNQVLHHYEKHTSLDVSTIPNKKKQLRLWSGMKNPFDIYKKQIDDLVIQCEDCKKGFEELSAHQVIFKRIKALAIDNIQNIESQIQNLEKTLESLTVNLDYTSEDSVAELEKIIQAETNINFNTLQNQYNYDIEQLIQQLSDKIDTPVSVNLGMMTKREIGIKRLTKRWLQSEITPLLYEIWEIRDGLMTGGKMIFMNLKNQFNIIVAQQKNNPNALPPIATHQIVHTFLNQLSIQVGRLETMASTIETRLDSKFLLSNILDTHQHFLPIESQDAISQILFDRNSIRNRFTKWWKIQSGKIVQYRSTLEHEEHISVSEKVVRYIKEKKGVADDTQYYQNIFLTKGYVGEAFWVGKEDEILRAKEVVDNWKLGYRGAILLTGERKSGKSLFGEMVANRYFQNKTIHLFPNSEIQVNGISTKISYDLGKALNQINTLSKNKSFLIWIDNLELWWDEKTPLNKNIRQLKSFMDSHSSKLFFMIATSSTFKVHLSKMHDIDKVFQAEIEMDALPLDEMEEAITIRHGATHKTLFNQNLEPLSHQQYRKIIRKIHKISRGNIGDALLFWSTIIRAAEDNHVICHFDNVSELPNILNANTGTLLTSIILQKRTNEFRLEQLFGAAYSQKYAGLVKRLIGVGILVKKIDGWLEVNELIVNEVVEQLKQKKYL